MAKLFKTAFAYQGAKEQLPDSAQPDGKASFAEGFTDDYTLDYGDADARDIAQSELNGIFHDVTEAIGELQKYGVAVWQSDMTPIAKYSLVFHDDKLWQAKKNTSATPAAGADWQLVDIADIVSQLGTLDLNDYATKTYVDNAVNGLASTNYVDSAVASKATASVVNAQLAGKFDKTDVVQESGQSTTKVMSQKAVTDALSDAAAGQLSWGAITGDIENQDDLQNSLGGKVDKETGKGLIDPAPLDGKEYARKDGTWVEVIGGESALADLTDVDFGTPTDGQVLTYDAATQKSKFTDPAGGGGGDVEEAPTDGEMYLRGNGTWNKYAGEKIIYVDFPLENGVPHKFTETDFTDTSAVYRGVAEVNEYYAAEYEAFYLQLIEGWVMHFSIQGYDYKVALMQGENLLLSARIIHNVPSALLPSGLSRVVYRGRFDVLEGLEGGSTGECEITVDSNSSYVADTLIESQNIPNTPLDFSLGDVEGFFTDPISLDSAPNSSTLTGSTFANGFGPGKVYWEVGFVYQDQDGDNMKVKFQSEAGGSSTIKFTLPIRN